MLDTRVRALYAPGMERLAARLAARGVTPLTVTGVGLAVGVGACIAAALAVWPLALVLWLANRTLDGLDGAVARQGEPSDLGGLLDFVADFVVYGGFVLAVAIAEPDARIACCALLVAYLLNNVALLSFASLIEKRQLAFGDERSLRFTASLTEGTETVLAYTAFCLLPGTAQLIAWIFTAMVLVSVAQRLAQAHAVLT